MYRFVILIIFFVIELFAQDYTNFTAIMYSNVDFYYYGNGYYVDELKSEGIRNYNLSSNPNFSDSTETIYIKIDSPLQTGSILCRQTTYTTGCYLLESVSDRGNNLYLVTRRYFYFDNSVADYSDICPDGAPPLDLNGTKTCDRRCEQVGYITQPDGSCKFDDCSKKYPPKEWNGLTYVDRFSTMEDCQAHMDNYKIAKCIHHEYATISNSCEYYYLYVQPKDCNDKYNECILKCNTVANIDKFECNANTLDTICECKINTNPNPDQNDTNSSNNNDDNNYTGPSDIDIKDNDRNITFNLDVKPIIDAINNAQSNINKNIKRVDDSINKQTSILGTKIDNVGSKIDRTNSILSEINNKLSDFNASFTMSNSGDNSNSFMDNWNKQMDRLADILKAQIEANATRQAIGDTNSKLDDIKDVLDGNLSIDDSGFFSKAVSLIDRFNDLIDDPSQITESAKQYINEGLDSIISRTFIPNSSDCGSIPEYSVDIFGSHVVFLNQDILDSLPLSLFRSIIIFMSAFSGIISLFRR